MDGLVREEVVKSKVQDADAGQVRSGGDKSKPARVQSQAPAQRTGV